MSDVGVDTGFKTAVESQAEGRGQRPAFEALWHLETLKVVSLRDFESSAWEKAKMKPGFPVIAVMDTPVEFKHPNLKQNVSCALMRDFSVFNTGEFPVPYEQLCNDGKAERDALCARIPSWTGRSVEQDGNTNDAKDPVASSTTGEETPSTCDELKAAMAASMASEVEKAKLDEDSKGFSDRPRQSLVDQVAGAHGTAVAGLIAGAPSKVKVQRAAYLGPESKPDENNLSKSSKEEVVTLPYAGINPFAKVIPISLTAAPYPDMVLGALTYLEVVRPDVIVIAAAWADNISLTGAQKKDETWSMELNESDVPLPSEDDEEAQPRLDVELWAEVTEKLKSLSRTSVVLCAAGNVDGSELVYPASLAECDDNQIWAVTACDADGKELSYAPPLKGNARMIKTLSTQLPRADRAETVVDPYEYRNPKLKQNHMAPTKVAPRDIITLDPGGRQGYNPTSYPNPAGDTKEPFMEIGSLYTRFSGTSAATAIAGGLVGLALAVEAAADPSAPQDPAQQQPSASCATGLWPSHNQLFDLGQAVAMIAARRMLPS